MDLSKLQTSSKIFPVTIAARFIGVLRQICLILLAKLLEKLLKADLQLHAHLLSKSLGCFTDGITIR